MSRRVLVAGTRLVWHAQNSVDKCTGCPYCMRCMHTEGPRPSYYVFLVCPSCHRSKWLLVTKPKVTREELLNTFWKFECPVHGALYEKPVQVAEKFAPFLPTDEEQ